MPHRRVIEEYAELMGTRMLDAIESIRNIDSVRYQRLISAFDAQSAKFQEIREYVDSLDEEVQTEKAIREYELEQSESEYGNLISDWFERNYPEYFDEE